MKSNHQELYNKLRGEFDSFVYESFSYSLDGNELSIFFLFRLGDEYTFRPEFRLPLPSIPTKDILTDSMIRNIIFNMGMIELISYWKAACPPKLIIKPAALARDQVLWWKKLYLHGLGEFFFQNGITPGSDFIEIRSEGRDIFSRKDFKGGDEVLVPIGGGKDSVVTLELLSKIRKCRPFIINPREASLKTTLNAGFSGDRVISLSRTIDPLLLRLNEMGFLNGHTPFSAMLAFASVLVAAVYDIREIALSNESSANEPTIPGTNINHQYSKSLEFEEDFRDYISKYVTEGIEYYSFLRPLNELQISDIFSRFPKHFSSFRSCNVGSKTDSWCGQCPKCLFTFTMLGVFIDMEHIIRIFGNNLFKNERLLPVFRQLCGLTEQKPFECVGSIDEVNAAVVEIIKKFPSSSLPPLLKYHHEHFGSAGYSKNEFARLMKDFDRHHIPGKDEIKILKDQLDVR